MSPTKNQRYSICIARSLLCIVVNLFTPILASANSANGNLIMTLDQNAMMGINGGSPAIGSRHWYVEDYFDQSYNNVLIDGAAPNPTPGYNPLPSPVVMKFPVNGATIPSAPEEASRLLQATTFNYADDPKNSTGVIGLSGAFRTLSDSWKGYLLPKEMTLSFDAKRVNRGGESYDPSVTSSGGHGESGWVIKTNEEYFGTQALFDLTNVTTATVNGALKLTGDLTIAIEWGTLVSANQGIKVGSVSLVPNGDTPGNPVVTPTPVPNPVAGSSYDDVAQEATLVDVQVQNLHYFVQLQLQSNGLFSLKSAQLLAASQPGSEPAQYDELSQILIIPKINALGKVYRVELTNVGNYQFSVEQLAEIQ